MQMIKKLQKYAVTAAAVLTLGLLVPMPDVSAEYPQVDMFEDSMAVKGLQGVSRTDEGYGTQHRLINLNIMDCYHTADEAIFANGYILPYQYKGKTYCLTIPEHIYNRVRIANERDESISIVFLMQWSDRASWLIDDAARDGGGHAYYAPETEGEAGEWLEAFFSFFCKEMGEQDLHVDNFILGNEVNMPNQWHYTGTSNAQTCATKYADAFRLMYNAVREHTSVSRCSISLDHSWNNDDEGRGIAARDFLTRFAARLDAVQPGINWCVSTHLYPSTLYEPDFWNSDLNSLSENARIIDGKNLYYMTNYIREHFGESHRVMLTEQGFCDDKGENVQAASLAYSYYAAMYDPMVDCFIINTENAGSAEGHSLNFDISGTLAGIVYEKIGNGNQADQDWIASVCLPVIGVDSWSEIIPYYPGSSIGGNTRLNGLHRATDGNWYYYSDDQVVTNYTGLVYDETVGWWYVENGCINFGYNGLVEYGGAWWCVAGGQVRFDYTGLWNDANVGWWYVENGCINFSYNGLVLYGDVWWCVAGGTIVFDYTGLWYDPIVGWWYVENGMINFGYNGLIEYGGAWWCVAGGQVRFDYTGLWNDANVGWWYVENGMINFGYNGLVLYGDIWWCVAGGTIAFDYTGLWNDPYVGWWYVENGYINFAYNGLVLYNDVWWCVAGGQLIFDYTGLWNDANVGWWYVENGTINFGYDGLIQYGDAWWCVADGYVVHDYTGLWSDPNVGWWYVENGTINFDYNGVVEYNGNEYNVSNGAVVF